MHIIFEGQDRCGKTTQAKEVMKYMLDKPIQQLHYTTISGLDDKASTIKYSKSVYKQMFKFLRSTKTNYILDRAHLGEFVYGNLYRKYTENQASYVFKLEQQMKASELEDTYLVVLVDSSNRRLEREDGQSISVDIKKAAAEVERFKKAFELSTIKNKILIDISDKKEEEVASLIKKLLGK